MKIKTAEVKFRSDLYPRINKNPELVQKYAANLECLPPIEINQHNELIDGWHRWTAHKKNQADEIETVVTVTATETDFLKLAIIRNSTHGEQMTDDDKRKMAIRLYNAGTGLGKDEIAKTLSVTPRMVNNYLTEIDKHIREDRKQRIFEMFLACATQEEIAEAVGLAQNTITAEIESIISFGSVSKTDKTHAFFEEMTEDGEAKKLVPGFNPPLYNVWSFAKIQNSTRHFGNSEQRILENLLYLYTEPFNIVIDPFAGGGSTIDVCKKRLRRYWASDRKPLAEREDIRRLDVCEELPDLRNRWSNVRLVYLDPPYWKQAEGQYSEDPEDMANMNLDDFTAKLAGIVKRFSAKLSTGCIALLIQPTQWKSENRNFTDHVLDVVSQVGNKKLILENRISCPYSTEQYNAQQVEWAKEHKKCLVITRELIVWRINDGKMA